MRITCDLVFNRGLIREGSRVVYNVRNIENKFGEKVFDDCCPYAIF